MSELIGAIDVQDMDEGYWFDIVEGGPVEGVAAVRGTRVLIPGRVGLYTTADPFEDEHLLVRYHGIVWGDGATPEARRASYATRFQALKTACDVAAREDVMLTSDGDTISAGFLRFVGPTAVGGEIREFDIEFDATDPPEWDLSS
jgi:hypothetical protein